MNTNTFRAEKVIEAGVDVCPSTHLWSSGSSLSCLTLFAFLTLSEDRNSVKDKNYYIIVHIIVCQWQWPTVTLYQVQNFQKRSERKQY